MAARRHSLLLCICAALLGQLCGAQTTSSDWTFGRRKLSQHTPGPATEQPQEAACPKPYERQTMDAIRSKQVRPYLFGGSRTPCDSCKEGQVEEFCQFLSPRTENGTQLRYTREQDHNFNEHHICDKERQGQIVDWAVGMGFDNLLQMTPCDLWQVLQHRSLWIIGDSQSADTWVAMACFMREFWNQTVMPHPGNADAEAMEFLKEATRTGGTAVSLEAVKCAELTAGGGTGRICHMRVNELESELALGMATLQHLSRGTQPIVVSNWGLWQHREHIFASSLQQLLLMLNTGQYPFWIWKDTPPQHFRWRNGEFYGAGEKSPFQCFPHNTTLQPDKTLVAKPGYEAVLTGLWRNTVPYNILHAHIPYVNTWNHTSLLWNFHRNNYGHGHECSHYCHPGAPQLWVYHIYEKIKAFAPADVVLPEKFHPSKHMSHRRQSESDL